MGVAAEDGVDAVHPAGHLQVHVHAVVGQHHHHLGALCACLVHELLHGFIADAIGPVGHHVAGVGDGGVGEGLADDGNLQAVHLLHGVGLEDLVAEVVGDDVLRDEVDAVFREIVLHHFHHPVGAEGGFPVGGHDVHTQLDAGVHHVLGIGPQGGGGTLPGIAAIQQQGTGTGGAHLVHQCLQVGKAAHLAVGLGSSIEIDIGESGGIGRAGLDAVVLEELVAHQVGHLAVG